MFLTNPAPICVLDEVDAPLDDANVERFCELLDQMGGETDTRYLIVTHNAVTMSRMHRLYGVTMIEKGVSLRGQCRIWAVRRNCWRRSRVVENGSHGQNSAIDVISPESPAGEFGVAAVRRLLDKRRSGF